jgi:ribonuclease HI
VEAGGAAIVYTDGACTGNPGPAGLGVVVLREKGRVERSEYLGNGTNNIAELTAIQRALEMTEGPVVIHTDSQYAIGVLTKGWKAKANTALIEGIRGLLGRRSGVRFVYVRGHAGVPLNERADELARMAISTGQTRTEQV